ncbi:unnamed protein product, partial [Meganyctiphanes norvegica]
ACGDDFKKDFLQEFELLLDAKLTPMNTQMNQINVKLATFERCPGGVIVSTQCFTVFRDHPSNWTDAVKRCQSEGLVLAEPSDTVAVPLRRFLLDRYGDGSFWLSARGDQRKFVWQSTNKDLDDDSTLWSPGQPGDRYTPLYCLSLLAWDIDLKRSPGQPYYSQDCSNVFNYPLCERILEKTETLKSPTIALAENISITLDTIENDLIDSILMYNKSIDEILQDTQLMKESLLVLEENLSTQLESVETNISTTLDRLHQDTQLMKEPLLVLGGNLSTQLESVETNIITTLDKIYQDTQQMKGSLTLEEMDQRRIKSDKIMLQAIKGFCVYSQCFTLIADVKRNWTDAKAKCEEEGLILAEPSDLVAVPLRRYLVEKYDHAEAWLGAQGDGSKFVWQHSGTALMNDSPLWDVTASSNAGNNNCVELDVNKGEYDADSGKPYDISGCTANFYTLCEII